jgi:predicted amidophosphoribosyltransferase
MRCSKCGRENRAGRRFCAHCGAKLTLVCASCKAENEPGEQFCGECGEQLAEPAKPRPNRAQDHAQRACYAALYLRDELRPKANELRIARGMSFSLRMWAQLG